MGSGGEQPESYPASPPRPGAKNNSPAKPGRGRFQSLLERDKKASQLQGRLYGPRDLPSALEVGRDMRAVVALLTTPVPEGKLWQGEIQWRRGLRRTAVLSIRTADGNAVAGAPTVPIMHATQKFKSGTLNMHLDLCKQVGGHRFAKIREPKKHHYVFYDNGANPKRPHKARGRPMRVTLGACKISHIYDWEPLQMSGMFPDASGASGAPNLNLDFVHMLEQGGPAEGCAMLKTKKTKFNPDLKTHMIKFEFTDDRSKLRSLHNFIMFRDGSDDEMVVQVGKIDDKKYALDVQAPLSPLQAFLLACSHMCGY